MAISFITTDNRIHAHKLTYMLGQSLTHAHLMLFLFTNYRTWHAARSLAARVVYYTNYVAQLVPPVQWTGVVFFFFFDWYVPASLAR